MTVLEVTLTVMVALAVVVGLQMVGVVLMAAMIIAPAVAARQWTRRLEHMVILSAVIGMASGVSGAVISALGRGLATGQSSACPRHQYQRLKRTRRLAASGVGQHNARYRSAALWVWLAMLWAKQWAKW